MMRTILLRDTITDYQCLGLFLVIDPNNIPVFGCQSIERGWRDNRKNISCVPEGKYDLVFEWSPRFEMYLWELKGVPNRSECKIHPANHARQLNGCISLGYYRKDIDLDGYLDIGKSKSAVNDFHRTMSELKRSTIEILNSGKICEL